MDANARQDAVLMLSSVNLPGGVQVDFNPNLAVSINLTFPGSVRVQASQVGERRAPNAKFFRRGRPARGGGSGILC